MNGRTAKSFSRYTLKRGEERIWKRFKQHVSPSNACWKNGKMSKERLNSDSL